MNFGANVRCEDFCDPLIFDLVSPTGQSFHDRIDLKKLEKSYHFIISWTLYISNVHYNVFSHVLMFICLFRVTQASLESRVLLAVRVSQD